jgi:hypothetical protein
MDCGVEVSAGRGVGVAMEEDVAPQPLKIRVKKVTNSINRNSFFIFVTSQ